MSSQPAEISIGLVGDPPVSIPTAEGAELGETPAAETATLRPPLEAQLVQQGKLSMGQLAQAHRDRMEKGGSVLDIVVERGWVSAEDVAALRAQQGEPAPVVQAVPEPEPEPTAEPAPVVHPVPEPEVATAAAPMAEPAPIPAPAPAAAPAPVAEVPEIGEPEPEPAPEREPAVETLPALAPEPVAEPADEAAPPAAYTVAVRLTTGELIAAGRAADPDQAEALAQAVVADVATHGDCWPRFGGRYLKPETIVSVDIVPA